MQPELPGDGDEERGGAHYGNGHRLENRDYLIKPVNPMQIFWH